MDTQLVHRWQGRRHAIRNNAEEDRKLQIELNRLNSSSLRNMDKIKEEMLFLKKQLMENRKGLGTRSDLQVLRADSGNRRRKDNDEVNGNVGQSVHGQPWKEAVVDREEKNLSPGGEVPKAKLISLPNTSFRRERRLSACRVLETPAQIDGSRNETPQSKNSTGTISSCSHSSRFTHDPSRAGGSLTRRTKVSLGRSVFARSHDLHPHNQRRFSLPGHINPASQTSPVGKAPGSILNKANLPQSQNGAPKVVRNGKESKADHIAKAGKISDKESVLRARRYSLPICNFHEQGNTANSWLLAAKLPLGKYSQRDAVKARLSQLSSLGLINGKKTCRAEYGKKPRKVRSPLIESTENCGLAPKPNAGVPGELIQKTEDEEEEDDDEEDYSPSEDPQLRSIPKITLNEKIQRFFADYVEGAGQAGGVDFEQLLMECRIGKEETAENEESSQTEGSEVESAKESQASE